MTPSRKPRRNFAAPLIMTVAAVPLSACVVTSNKPATGDPKQPPERRDHRDGEEQPPGVHTNPPMQKVNPVNLDSSSTHAPGVLDPFTDDPVQGLPR